MNSASIAATSLGDRVITLPQKPRSLITPRPRGRVREDGCQR